MKFTIIRLQWQKDTAMTEALGERLRALPEADSAFVEWEPVSLSATADEVIVLAVLKPVPLEDER